MKPPPTFNRWSNSKIAKRQRLFRGRVSAQGRRSRYLCRKGGLWKLRKLENSKTQLALTADASNMSMVCILLQYTLLSKARSPPASCHRWSFEKRPGTCTLQYWLIHQRSQLLLYDCLCTLTGMWLLRGNLAQPRPAVEAMLARNRGSVRIGFSQWFVATWNPKQPVSTKQSLVKQPFPM